MKPFLIQCLTCICIFYITLCVALFTLQRDIIYQPDKRYQKPEAIIDGMQEINIITDDDLTLTSWFYPAQEGKHTIIYFHGNAGGILDRADYYQQLINEGYGVFALEYRGYSRNEGTPSEDGLYADARAAIQWLKTQHVSEDNMIFMGRSLGTGIAIQMATEHEHAATFLMSPYTSIADLAKERYSFVPIDWLLKDRFDSIHKVGKLTAPTYIFHGSDDMIIPVEHAYHLHKAIQTAKAMVIQDGQNHNNLTFDNVIAALKRFETLSIN